MKRIISISLLITLTFLVSCSSNQDKNFSEDQLPIAKGGEEGFSFGLYEGEQIESKRTFYLDDNEPFHKNVVFGNMTSSHMDFVLMIFDHANQISFLVDDEDYNVYEFSIPSMEYRSIPVNIPPLEDGFHAVHILIVKKPDEVNTNIEEIYEMEELAKVYPIRVNLFQGTAHIGRKSEEITYPDTLVRKKGRVGGVLVSEVGQEYKILTYNHIQDNDRVKLGLTYGNQGHFEYDFYIVALLNWQQVPISEGITYIYDQLKPGEEKHVDAEISNVPSGRNIYQTIILPSPYDELPDENPYTLANVDSSFRVRVER